MDLLIRLKRFFNIGIHVRNTAVQTEQHIIYAMRHDALIEKALNSKEAGVTTDRLCENEVIVSLTTYGKRLYEVASTIESIMQGSMKPNRIMLWLDNGLKETILPISLQKQQKRGLDIAFCKDIRSYKKLIPTLQKFPNAVIITIDDDVLYHYDFVENMINHHKKYPQCIIANRIHRIVLDNMGYPVTYMKWKFCDNPTDDSPLNFFTGVGGVLYPPNAMDDEVFNESVFMDICKYADDIWFKAMSLKNGTNVLKCYTHDFRGEDYLLNRNVQDVALYRINTDRDAANDRQLKAVFEKYGLWKLLAKNASLNTQYT